MLGKTSKPVIEILTGSLISGDRYAAGNSPRGLKNFDFGGVGLGIVAALENSGGGRSEIPALFGRNLTRNRASPIPVKNSWRVNRSLEEMEMDESLEEYTIVTCHGPDKSSTTRVYSGAAADGGRKGDDRSPFRIQSSVKSFRGGGVFHISSVGHADGGGIPAPDFLSACNLCNKKLHGKDIYMYRYIF